MKMISYKENETDEFELLVKNIFRFLETKYSCKIVKIEHTKFGTYIHYKNNFIGVRISYVPRDGGIFVDFIDLKYILDKSAGDFKYDLFDIISLKDSNYKKPELDMELLLKEDYLTANQYMLYLARALDRFSNEVLTGNLLILKQVENIQKKRAKAKGRYAL